mmetsp:Transcript_9664/g.29428  ORF Transcript_9664/g.29428 Transcript_9664/m.29428 type:complete len:80 (+) Transcript_9664:1024-1263(+)|eukprot:scaffold254614_cov28-Tisochrysis_lutea.AAC.1
MCVPVSKALYWMLDDERCTRAQYLTLQKKLRIDVVGLPSKLQGVCDDILRRCITCDRGLGSSAPRSPLARRQGFWPPHI